MSSGSTPGLSVVVISFNDAVLLERCLKSIADQIDQTHGQPLTIANSLQDEKTSAVEKIVIEVLIVRSDTNDDRGRFSRQLAELLVLFPRFRWVEAEADSTVPQKRALGVQKSRGDVVGLVEDDCILNSTWCANIVKAHENGHSAVGGSVQPGSFKTGLDWGVFFCEYARFLPPFQGNVQFLPGNNLSYKRTTLISLTETGEIKDGVYEVFVNNFLQQQGEQLYAAPDVSVTNINSWRLSNAMAVPYHHGRGFAAMRFAKTAVISRLTYSAIALVLPGLQTLRICDQVLSRKRYHSALLKALPSIMLFWTSWSIGEFMGYLLGPGRSLEQWR